VYVAVTRYKFDDLKPMIYHSSNYGATWRRLENGIAKDHFVRVVREDPKQPGLLYAGTEGGLYVSLNGGQHWHPFQSNLPKCAITDLTFRDNDLIAATSGRAFWVLDDLGALQQSKGMPDTTRLQLYRPKNTYKFTLAAPPEAPANEGKNPANGVIFDYYLPHSWTDSTELNLEVLDMAGTVIRTLTNEKPEGFKPWEGGPPPPQVLPSKAGLNRFNWDLRRDALPAVEGVFVMGDYRGHLVAPGTYTLRLSSDTSVLQTQVQVLADPRLNATTEEHATQQALLLNIENAVKDIHQSVKRLRTVKRQLEDRLELLEGKEELKELIELGKAVHKELENWENTLIQPKQETYQDVINFRNQLNAELLYLKAQVDSYTPVLTRSVQDRWIELDQQWQAQKNKMIRLIEDRVGGFNRMYEKRRVPALIVPKE
ncbi:MAG: glycosyl hydrolase, partial [Phaeodactylibacter sp.]|nr:glycosyl hydrolase [Phaeodactylibacter sp.]